MLPKEKRLTTRDLKDVGRFSLYRGTYFDVKITEKFTHKYGCILSKKTLKKAVERNKVKRVFYRILQEQIVSQKETYTEKGALFYPKKNTLTVSKEVLVKEIENSLKK